MYHDEATREILKRESELYEAIRNAYICELFDENGDKINQHCEGVHMAIHTIYNLGFSHGYLAGARGVRDYVTNNGAVDNALKNFQDTVAASYDMIRKNVENHGPEAAQEVNNAILNHLKDDRNTVKNIIIDECNTFKSV